MGTRFTATLIERMARTDKMPNGDPLPRGKLLADDIGVGLYLRFAKTGRVAFVRVDQREAGVTRNGKAKKWHEETIGYFPPYSFGYDPKLSIEEARAKVATQRTEARDDSAITWSDAAEKFLAFKANSITAESHKHLTHQLTEHFAQLAKTPLAKLHRKDVAAIVTDLYSRADDTAVKLLSTARSLMRWSVAQGFIEADPLSAMTRKDLLPGYKPKQRTRLLDDTDIRAVWNDKRPVGRVLLLQLLTGARREEALQLRLDQIDRKAKVWTKPAPKTKSRREHKVPLSPQALQLIDASFPVTLTKSAFMHLVEDSYKFRSHDCRRTCSTKVLEQPINASHETSNYILSHLPPKLDRSYFHHDPIPAARDALNKWGAQVEKIGRRNPLK